MGPQAVWVEVGSTGPVGPGAGRGRRIPPPPAPRTPAVRPPPTLRAVAAVPNTSTWGTLWILTLWSGLARAGSPGSGSRTTFCCGRSRCGGRKPTSSTHCSAPGS